MGSPDPENDPELRNIELVVAIEYHADCVDEWGRYADLPEGDEKRNWKPPHGDPSRPEYHQAMVRWLEELVNLRNSVPRLNELLGSTRNQCENYRQEIRTLKEKNIALADVIADLQMDIKARE